MILKHRLKGLLIFLTFFVIGLWCLLEWAKPSRLEISKTTPASIVINDSFILSSVSDVAFYNCVSLDSSYLPQFYDSEIPVNFEAGRDKILRAEPNKNQCFQYLEIINQSKKLNEFVLSIKDLRVDKISWYLLQKDSLYYQQTLYKKDTPSDRYYPFRNFSFPLLIESGDTLHLVIQSFRFSGFFDIEGTLFTKHKFLQGAISNEKKQTFILSFSILQILITFSIGVFFSMKKFIYFGIFLITIAIYFMNIFGYCFWISLPDNINLTCGNFVILSTLLVNASYHPFGLELVKDYIYQLRRIKLIAFGLLAMNLFAVFLFFLPGSDPPAFHTQMLIVLAISSIANIVFILITTALVFLRGGHKAYFLGAVLSLLSFAIIELHGMINNQKVYNTFISPEIIIITTIAAIIYLLRKDLMNRQNLQNELDSQKEELENQRKSEIREIGRNLHDHIGNSLASILGFLQLKEDKSEVIKSLALKTIKDIRIISHQLVDYEIKTFDKSISELISQLNDFSSIQFHFYDGSNSGINSIGKEKLNNVFHIVQELLTNILKHSIATEAYVQIFDNETNFQIVIEDDGVGMKHDSESDGIGLKNIRQRAKVHDLEFHYDSSEKGTSCFIIINKLHIT